jgi:hypothetical protein
MTTFRQGRIGRDPDDAAITSKALCAILDFAHPRGFTAVSRLPSYRRSGIVITQIMEAPAMKIVRFAWLSGATIGACLMLASRTTPAAESEAELEANRVAHDHVLCRKYGGYEEGTDEFAQCLDAMAKRRADAAADAKAKRRKETSQARALSAAENNACGTRSEVINGGGRGPSNAHEGGVGACGH